MTEELPPLDELKRKIAASRVQEAAPAKPRQALRGANSYGYIADLMAGFGVGTGLGYVADVEWNTLPVFTLLGLVLGSAAGFMLIYKASQREEAAAPDNTEAGEK